MKIVKVCIINAMLLLAIILVGSFGVFAESIANDYYITIEPKDVTIEGTNHLYKEVTIKLYLVNNTDSPYQTATGSQIPSQIKFDSTNPKVAYIENGKLYSGSSAGTTVITATCDPYGNGTMIRTVKTNVTVTNATDSSQTSTTLNKDYYMVMEPEDVTIDNVNKVYGDIIIKLYDTSNMTEPEQIMKGSKILSGIGFVSSDSNIAYVKNGQLYSGPNPGIVQISAVYVLNDKETIVRDTIKVTVKGVSTVNEEGISKDVYYITTVQENVKIDDINKEYGDITVKLYYESDPSSPVSTATGLQIPSTINFESSNSSIAYVSNGKLYSGQNVGKAIITVKCDPYKNGTMIRTATINVTVTDKDGADQYCYLVVEPNMIMISELNTGNQVLKVKIYGSKDVTTPIKTYIGEQIPSSIKISSSNPDVAYIENGRIYSGNNYGTAVINVISNLLDDGTPIREASINVIVSDKVMENPVFIAEENKPSDGIYTVTIKYPKSAVTKLYKIGENGNYQSYLKPIEIEVNGINIYAKAQNSLSVWSPESKYTVGEDQQSTDNINKIQYIDVTEEYWGYNSIMQMTRLGILEGHGDGTFRPEDAMTREQFAKVLALSTSMELINASSPTYADIPKNRWSYPYVETVKQYLNGYRIENEVILFKGEDVAQREDMVAAIVLAKGLENQEVDLGVLDIFIDKDNINPNLKDIIAIAVKNKIIEGWQWVSWTKEQFNKS